MDDHRLGPTATTAAMDNRLLLEQKVREKQSREGKKTTRAAQKVMATLQGACINDISTVVYFGICFAFPLHLYVLFDRENRPLASCGRYQRPNAETIR